MKFFASTKLTVLENHLTSRCNNNLLKSPDEWSVATEEDLTALSQRCREHWTETSPFINSLRTILCINVLMGILATVALGFSFPQTVDATLALLACVFMFSVLAGVLSVLVFGLCSENFGWGAAHTLIGELTPLSAGSCVRALKLMESSSVAKQYRDAILATPGRQLRTFDFAAMRALTRKTDWEVELKEKASACKKLHGMSFGDDESPTADL